MDERPGAETQNQHDGRRVNQHPGGIVAGGFHRVFHERGDPAIGAEFGRGLRHHDDDEKREQQAGQRIW